MPDTNHQGLRGVFNDRDSALRARNELTVIGYPVDRIEITDIVERSEVPERLREVPRGLRLEGRAIAWAIYAGIIGCLLGALLTTGVAPGIPVLLGGGALGGVVGAVIGIVVGAVIGGLIGWGWAEEGGDFYAREFNAGRTVLTVHDVAEPEVVTAVLNRYGAVRVEQLGPTPVGMR